MMASHVARHSAAAILLSALLACTPEPGDMEEYGWRLDPPYVPTTQSVAEAMLEFAGVKPDDVVYDLGSGDGRIPITAVRKYGVRKGVGIELNADLIRTSNENARDAGVADRVRFLRGDLFKLDFSEASIVTMYLLPDVNVALRPRLLELKPGTRIVTNLFDLGDWEPDRHISVRDPDPEGYNLTETGFAPLYLFIVPASAAGVWESDGGSTPVYLGLEQRYQKVSGTLRALGRTIHIRDGRLAGDRLHLGTADGSATGAVPIVFDARVSGNRLTGTLTLDGRTVPVTMIRR